VTQRLEVARFARRCGQLVTIAEGSPPTDVSRCIFNIFHEITAARGSFDFIYPVSDQPFDGDFRLAARLDFGDLLAKLDEHAFDSIALLLLGRGASGAQNFDVGEFSF
jgi:hypothetical protein